MSTYHATIDWAFAGEDFLRHRYSREHTVTLGGGTVIPGSASPHIVRAPWSRADAMDPEAAFTAYRARRLERCRFVVEKSLAICRGQLGRGPLIDNAQASAEMSVLLAQPI